MRLSQSIVVAVGVAAGLWHSAGCARAGGMFGPSETVRHIAPTRDPQYVLGHKVYTYYFVLGCYARDDGYVLQQVGVKDQYVPLDAEKIRQLQKQGVLPTPLPAYSLGIWDYLLGYSNWVLLAVLGTVYAVRRVNGTSAL